MKSAPGRAICAAPLAAFPWLNPFTVGPTPAVVPWLTSMACVLGLWVLAMSGGPRLPWRLALAGALLLQAWAGHPAIQQEAVFMAGGLTLVVVGAAAVSDEGVGGGLAAGLLAAAALSAVVGLCQYFGISALFSPWMDSAQAGEAFGNLRQPNQYATLCWLGFAVLLWGMPQLHRAAALGLALLLAVASAASVSRTGLLQGLLLTGLAALWPGPGRRRRLELCVAAALAYSVASVLLPFVLQALTGALPARTLWGRIGGGETCSSRFVLWSNVLHLIVQKPLLGWGWGELDYAHFSTLYPGVRFCDILDNAHNLPLHLAVELGVPAALAVCGGFAWWAWRQRPWAERMPQRQLAWAILAVILLHSLLEYPLWYGPFQMTLGVALGWLTQRPAATARAEGAAISRPALAMAGALLLATAYAAWDYLRVSQVYLPPSQRRAAWADDAMGHARQSWLFANQARFAELTLTTLSRENAAWMYARAQAMLHYSPEPRVIERAIESAAMLGRDDEAVQLLARYKAAFPQEAAAWSRMQRRPLPPRGNDQG